MSLHDTVGVTDSEAGAAQAPGFGRMTAVDVLGRVDELADGTGGSVDAATGAAIGPYRKFRLTGPRAASPGERRSSMTRLRLGSPLLALLALALVGCNVMRTRPVDPAGAATLKPTVEDKDAGDRKSVV